MNAPETLEKLKAQFELDRHIELMRSAQQAMERAKAISQTEPRTSEAFIAAVTERSGVFTARNIKPLIVQAEPQGAAAETECNT